jgi:hypothetical protein
VSGIKRTPRKTLWNKADRLWAVAIKARDGHCLRCGQDYHLEAAHIWGRNHYGVRWDLENGIALCRSCHVKFTYRPAAWHLWIQGLLGPAKYDALALRANTAKADVEVAIAELEAV